MTDTHISPSAYSSSDALTKINVPCRKNELLTQAIENINKNEELFCLWKISNVNAIDRLGFTDHGPVHVQIVANIALRLLRILVKHQVKMSIVQDFQLTNDHAELVVVVACLLHDLGMTIHRLNHEEYSMLVAMPYIDQIIGFLPHPAKTIVKSEILHAMVSHRSAGHPYTIEANIVRTADALDMSSGRSRIPFTQGKVDIHSLSAFAIDKVEINEGKDKPIEVEIFMNNSAGIFQVDQLLKEKLSGSKIEQYLQVKAYVKGDTERKLITEYSLK